MLVDALADFPVQALVVFSAGALVGFCQGDDFRSFAAGHPSSIICSSFFERLIVELGFFVGAVLGDVRGKKYRVRWGMFLLCSLFHFFSFFSSLGCRFGGASGIAKLSLTFSLLVGLTFQTNFMHDTLSYPLLTTISTTTNRYR